MIKIKKEKDPLKGRNYIKFQRLLEKAEVEGRLDGKYKCPVCGMRFLSAREAKECCQIVSE